ncbi:MAG: nucleoside monophosphate kinase [Patescibacteria group bacterium]|nr:nucleoside monophosphate kinase [Patescibacteria group bacterium]
MKIVLFGIQGSGKSTQGNLLSKQLNLPYLSTGHILRQLSKEKTKLGRYIKETINAGFLVPDEKMIKIVDGYLNRKEYQRGYILDGFPRTLYQAKKFKNNIDKAIYLKISDKEALWRLLYRNDDGREDETLPALKKRIDLFKKFTLPVVDFYQKKGKLAVINGSKSIEEVNEEILKNLGKQLIKNQIKSWENKQKAIIAIVGLPGAGKTEAAEYFKKKGLPVISFGKIINDYIDKKGLPHIEKIHHQVRTHLREKYGKEALAVLNIKNIKKLLKKNLIIIIDGMRSWEEYIYLKKELPKVNIFILALFANKELRYQRINQRKDRKTLKGEERDIGELIDTNMGPTIAFADFLIKNNFSKEDFYDKLDEVYRIIYFSL